MLLERNSTAVKQNSEYKIIEDNSVTLHLKHSYIMHYIKHIFLMQYNAFVKY